jgi:serine phosphatase RsbU (regulator of sigma subunit)
MKNRTPNELTALKNELELLTSLIMKIRMDMDLDGFLDEIIFTLRDKVPFDGCNIALIGDDGLMRVHRIDPAKVSRKSRLTEEKLEKIYSQKIDYRTGGDLASIVSRERREIYHPEITGGDLTEEQEAFVTNYGITSLYYLPVAVDERVFGTIRFHNYGGSMILSDFERDLIRRRVMIIAKALESFSLYNELRKKSQVIKTDLEMASRLQQNLLPHAPPRFHGVDIATRYIPMTEVGGDYFDFIHSPAKMERRFGVVITDASGHGVPAAFITSMLKMSLQNKAIYALASSPAKVLSAINESLRDKISDFFVTGCYAWFDFDRMKARFASAGHVPVYRIVRATGLIEEIKPRGRLLGILDNPHFDQVELGISPGDRFFFYTDGLTEAVNAAGVPFEESLLRILREEIYSNAAEMLYAVISALKEHGLHGQKHSLDDDVAVVIVDIV